MHDAELLLVSLLIAVAGLSALANALDIPYPIVLVVGGAVVGFIPGMPDFTLDPDVVLLIFLPPLLYGAAFFANLRQIRNDLRTITLNSVGLVLLTVVLVAVAAHELIDDLPWGSAFALGAIVSPTDPLAGSMIMRRLGAPRRLINGIEGEGLFNDATALVAYRVAVVAVVTGSFSLGDATLRFFGAAAGGIAIGVAVGWLISEIRRRIADAQVSITISLLSGYAAFVPADALGLSGVLAAVTTGIFMGLRGPSIIDARTRLQGFHTWDVLDFIVNAILFVLIGLQLPVVVDGLDGYEATDLALWAIAISLTVIACRFVWIFSITYVIRALDRRPSQRLRRTDWHYRFVAAWSGMRGAVSLAAALALPLETDAGDAFPGRSLIIFLVFAVILATLVLQGLSLPAVMRAMHVEDDGSDAREELEARRAANAAALARIDEIERAGELREESVTNLRRLYQFRQRRLDARATASDGEVADIDVRSRAYQEALVSVLAAERAALVDLRNADGVSNEVMNRVLRELDLEESRLEI